MTPEFQYLLNLSGNGAQGKQPDMPPIYLDWTMLFRLANEQTVATLVAHALKTYPCVSCPSQLLSSTLSTSRSTVINNYLRKEHILALLKIFGDQGIRAVLLKGYAVAREYCTPEFRVSSDTDIWIDPSDENRACELLKRQGFAVEPRWKNGHHAVCQHPIIGCVELHVILYDEIVEEVWFNRMDGSEFICEPFEKVNCDGGSYYTLGKTDHLIFLTLHMIKHFIISGMSLRMMLDVALFMKNHSSELDMDRFWNTMRNLEYDRCVSAILWAMVRYAGFAEMDFIGICSIPLENTTEILDDLELGGSMGIKDKVNREMGWHAYNREKLMRSKNNMTYTLYMLRWKLSDYIEALFPNRDTLSKRYQYIIEKPWLIPYAWLHRLFIRGLSRLKRGQINTCIVIDEEKLASSGRKRLEMFRKLGMI